MAVKQKEIIDEIGKDSVDAEITDAIVDEPEESIFGETLGSVPEETVEEELKEEPVKEEVAKEEVIKEVVVKEEVVKEEPVIAKEPEKPKDELEDQIKAAVIAALPKEEPKAEDDKLIKQLKDTRDYATQTNQENGTLRQNITTIEAQLAEAARQLKDAGIEITPSQQYQPPAQYTPPTQYRPPVQPQIDSRLDASMTSADSKFTPTVVDEYLHPQNGRFQKMLSEGNRIEIFQKIDASLDPLVEAINLTKEWEQGQEKNITQKAEDRDTLINSIATKVREQIGIGGQPPNGGKSRLPTNLNDVRADSNLATKGIKAGTEEEEETFGEHLG